MPNYFSMNPIPRSARGTLRFRVAVLTFIVCGLVSGLLPAQTNSPATTNAPETGAVGTNTTPPVPVLQINAGKVTGKVSPTLYGLMTEEINYSYEGGLYGELIRNRTFKANRTEPVFWNVVG